MEKNAGHHAAGHWPALEEVTITWRGRYGYLIGYLSDNDDDRIKLRRIEDLGLDDDWALAIWQASIDSYTDAILLNRQPTGRPNQALDTACTLYSDAPSDRRCVGRGRCAAVRLPSRLLLQRRRRV